MRGGGAPGLWGKQKEMITIRNFYSEGGKGAAPPLQISPSPSKTFHTKIEQNLQCCSIQTNRELSVTRSTLVILCGWTGIPGGWIYFRTTTIARFGVKNCGWRQMSIPPRMSLRIFTIEFTTSKTRLWAAEGKRTVYKCQESAAGGAGEILFWERNGSALSHAEQSSTRVTLRQCMLEAYRCWNFKLLVRDSHWDIKF